MDKNIPPRPPRPARPGAPGRPAGSSGPGQKNDDAKKAESVDQTGNQVTLPQIVAVFGVAFVALTAGWYFLTQNAEDDISKGGATPDTVQVQRDVLPVVSSPGSYETYDASKLSLASNGRVVIFFNASWCPSCQAIDADVNANLNRIPSDLHILKLDYDADSVLRKKYDIKVQHTMVQVDSSGNMIKKWTGGTTLASVVERLQ